MHIDGVEFFIIDMTSVPNLSLFLGLSADSPQELTHAEAPAQTFNSTLDY